MKHEGKDMAKATLRALARVRLADRARWLRHARAFRDIEQSGESEIALETKKKKKKDNDKKQIHQDYTKL